MYDLRSDTEIEKYQTHSPNIEGVDVIRTPVFSLEDYSPEMMAKWVRTVDVRVDLADGTAPLRRRFELYASGKTEVSDSNTLSSPPLDFVPHTGLHGVVFANSG